MSKTYFDHVNGIVTVTYARKQYPQQDSAAEAYVGDLWDGETITPGDRGQTEIDKSSREENIGSQTVTVDGMVFDACRCSQNDMVRNIMVAQNGSTVIQWKMHNQSGMTAVTRDQLESALELAVALTTAEYTQV